MGVYFPAHPVLKTWPLHLGRNWGHPKGVVSHISKLNPELPRSPPSPPVSPSHLLPFKNQESQGRGQAGSGFWDSMPMKTPPNEVWCNDTPKLALKLGPCVWTQACKLCQRFVACEFDILGSRAGFWCMCVGACSNFYWRFKLVKAFISWTVKSLNMTFQFIEVLWSPSPRNFSLATFLWRFQSSVSLLRAIFPSSHFLLSPLCLPTPTCKFSSISLCWTDQLPVKQLLCFLYSLDTFCFVLIYCML